jgi:hypothetical protein
MVDDEVTVLVVG